VVAPVADKFVPAGVYVVIAVPDVPLMLAAFTVGVGGRTLIVNGFCVPVPALLVAETVPVNTPLTEGVPLIKPVVALTDRPAGNPVAPHVRGVAFVGMFDAAIWNEPADPCVKLALLALEITGAAFGLPRLIVTVPDRTVPQRPVRVTLTVIAWLAGVDALAA
jgi:hypothetical protein